ncbi:MAG: glycosyltransferase [Bacilli bacterium]
MRLKIIDDGADRTDASVYLRTLTDRLLEGREPWVVWQPGCLPQRLVDGLGETLQNGNRHDCCVAGQPRPQEMSWTDYFIAGRGAPYAWNRGRLLDALREIRYFPPSVSHLPFQIALRMETQRPSSLEVTPTKEPWAFHRRGSLPACGLRFMLPLFDSPPTMCPVTHAPPLATVIICAYNEASRIGWAIRSVAAQTRSDWEIIVVDDGSTDDTAALAKAFDDPRVRVETLKENYGKSAALNHALALAKGRCVVELDADDWLDAAALETLCGAMAANPQPMVLLSSRYHMWRRSRRGELVYRGVHGGEQAEVTALYARVPIPRCYRTVDLTALGGWPTQDQSQGRIFEDVAMTLRYLRSGGIEFLDPPLYHRVIRPGSVSQRSDQAYRTWIQDFRVYLH